MSDERTEREADLRETREARQARWMAHMEAQAGSGQSVAAYCRAQGLHGWQFHYWRRRLGARHSEPSSFVEVPVRVGSGVGVEIGDVRVRVEPGFDAGTLQAVVAALRCSC